jgi:hypothetical protein
MNKQYLKAVLIQACKDIENSINEIAKGVDELNDITISIHFTNDLYPNIHIIKDYNKYITFTNEIEGSLLDD